MSPGTRRRGRVFFFFGSLIIFKGHEGGALLFFHEGLILFSANVYLSVRWCKVILCLALLCSKVSEEALIHISLLFVVFSLL